ncbi:MAG TPA: septum formation inhibitor Maf [Pseudomonas sabulinigri]|uniref:Maf-like protein n=1 Tax=marine sediment metagenome TaxID=412755 RepID=A0A0F9VI89_9ZZZZ|nr:septum formation inhibitor Maf [Halopseudomonas sabulinigri]HEC53216.1 septum formation inhibitor Maf [Halopseudomonas sabulinigri]|tara:strand:+ start:428 stop:1006 length:579 start_codon:yes stop_codon:yes gene_type:complete
MLPLILASSSRYRKSLLERLHLPFESAAPDVDETPLQNEQPEQLTRRLALAKAQALQARYPAHLIIGSDQVVLLDNELVSKPGTHAEAREQLTRSSGKTLTFSTALCLLNSASGKHQVAMEPYSVTFRELNTDQIERYLLQDKPYDCAGSFKSEGFGISLIERMHGDDPNSLIGLPLIRLCQMLAQEGIYLP